MDPRGRVKCTHFDCLGYSKPIGLCVESPTNQVEIGIMLFCSTPGGHFAYEIVLTTVASNDIHANNKHATSNHDIKGASHGQFSYGAMSLKVGNHVLAIVRLRHVRWLHDYRSTQADCRLARLCRSALCSR